jgi:hypothetical protein
LLEIAGDGDLRDEFVELEVLGPIVNLTTGQQEYPESLFLPAGNFNKATLNMLLWIDYPYNQNRRRLEYQNYQETDKFLSSTFATPTEWYRFSTNLGFYPLPDNPYQVQSRIYQVHPINYNNVPQTPILLPQDWNEIIVLAAAQKGFLELEEYEKSTAIGTLLRGDPKYPAKPGMLYGRKKKRTQEDWRQNQSLSPMIRRYGYGRRW